MRRLAAVALVVVTALSAARKVEGEIDEKMMKSYIKQSRSSDEDNRTSAAYTLGEYKSPLAVKALIACLNDTWTPVRLNAAIALYNIGQPLGEEAIPALRVAVKDRDNQVRVAAIDALVELGVPLKDLTPDLARLLDAPEGRVRVEASKVWLRRELPVADIAPALSLALRDPDEMVRKDAVDVVADMDKVPTALVGVVQTALKDKSSNVRASATTALSKVDTVVGGEAKTATYLAGIRDRNDGVRRESIEGLGKLGVASPEVVAAIVRALKDKDEFVRKVAIQALADLKAKDAIPALWEVAKSDKEWSVQSAARDALHKLGEKAY
jgi:HEAT repeat protein